MEVWKTCSEKCNSFSKNEIFDHRKVKFLQIGRNQGFSKSSSLNDGDLSYTESSIEKIKSLEGSLIEKDEENKSNANEIASKINELKFTKEIAAKENGELYGSLSVSDIFVFLSENEVSIQKKSIKLGNKIKTTGEHSVDIDLHPEVNCSLDMRSYPLKLLPKTIFF